MSSSSSSSIGIDFFEEYFSSSSSPPTTTNPLSFISTETMSSRILELLTKWTITLPVNILSDLKPTNCFNTGGIVWIPKVFNIWKNFIEKKIIYTPKPSANKSMMASPYPMYLETPEYVGLLPAVAHEMLPFYHDIPKYECFTLMHAEFLNENPKINVGDGNNGTIPQDQVIKSVFSTWNSGVPVAYLNAFCGAGKTVMALEIIRRNGNRAAICIADTGIGKQTEMRIKTFLPNASIGWVHGDRCEILGKDIIIVSLKSLLSRGECPPLHDYTPDEFINDLKKFKSDEEEWNFKNRKKISKFKEMEELFGEGNADENNYCPSKIYKKYPWQLLATIDLLILDEAHGFASAKHLQVFKYFCSKRFLTLTATPTREGRECKEVMWVLGKTAAILERPPQNVMIKSFYITSTLKNPPMDKHGNIFYSKAITILSKNDGRNQKIAKDILKAYKDENRYILVLSYRKKQLIDLAAFVKHHAPEAMIGMYFPESPESKREEILKSQIIFATYQRAAQALDVPKLNAVFLTLPIKSNTKQVVGRILRSGGKSSISSSTIPVVYDYVDKYCSTFQGLWYARRRFYEENDYTIETETTDVSSDSIEWMRMNWDVIREKITSELIKAELEESDSESELD